jgi:hypothetical protein
MLGEYVVNDLEVDSLQIGTATSWGHNTFLSVLKNPTSDIRTLKKRILSLLALRNSEAFACTETIKTEIETNIAPHVQTINDWKSGTDPRIKESIEQILWSPTSFGAFLNSKDWVLRPIVFWKTVVLPILSIIIPIIAIIIPYFIIRFLHGQDISIKAYISYMKRVAISQISIPTILRAKSEGDILGHIFEYIFIGLTAGTFISGIWTQILAARHLGRIATDIRGRGDGMRTMLEAVERILESLNTLPARIKKALRDIMLEGEQVLAEFADFPAGVGGMAAYGYIWNSREKLEKLEGWIGHIDAMIAIARTRGICFPRFLKDNSGLSIRGLHHPNISRSSSKISANSKTSAVVNDIVFDSDKTHVLLTGPNRGGKSTLCRSVGVAILCAQSWGFAWAKSMSFTPFNHIHTALHPADTLGKQSLFEAEIEFAKAVLADPADRTFIMMDEIFHSTNARDGIAASRVFLQKLYAKHGVFSVISTHYRELAEEFKDEVHAWAMETKDMDAEGTRLEYTYKVIPGISDKSSVMEILRERGLLDNMRS